MEEQRVLQALDGLAVGFNANDIDGIMGYFAKDCSLDLSRGPDPHGTRFWGRDQVRRGIMSRFESTPDVHLTHVKAGDARSRHTKRNLGEWLRCGAH